MASPTLPHVIGLTASSLAQGGYIVLTNLTRSSTRVKVQVDGNKKALLDLKNDIPEYQSGDVILIETHGKQEGGKEYTVSGGGSNITLSTSASSAPAVSI